MYFLTMKRNIQYTTEGIWTSNHTPAITLSGHMRSLYSGWKNDSLPSFTSFRKYYKDFQTICASEQVSGRDSFFLLRSSTNKCKEQIRSVASKRLKVLLCLVLEYNKDVETLSQLEDLLEPRMSASLIEMTRLDPKNCRPNKEFTVMLKRKL